jgi:hypothetical protein
VLAVSLGWRQVEDVPVRARTPLVCLLAELEGVLPMMPEGIMLIVENDPAKVETALAAGVVQSVPGVRRPSGSVVFRPVAGSAS